MKTNIVLQGDARTEVVAMLRELRFRRFLNSGMFPKPEKGHCKWCGGELPNGLRVWHNGKCRQEAYVRMGYADRYIFERDNGICSNCGIDTQWLEKQLLKIYRQTDYWRVCSGGEFALAMGPWGTDFCRRLWEADHILPVCEGGGCCGLENYQTLCLRCHKEESALLAKRRANKTQDSMGLFPEG
jgi:hypothetical protein